MRLSVTRREPRPARVTFRNADNPVGGPHEAVVTTTTDVEIIAEGGAFISSELFLGRCNKI
jgi:hypothetical protein